MAKNPETGASAQDSKMMVRQLFEKVWNKNDLETAKEIIHTDYSSVENIDSASIRGLTILQEDMKFYREMYSNLKFEIDRMFTREDTVVSMWRASGVANHEEFRQDMQTDPLTAAEYETLASFGL